MREDGSVEPESEESAVGGKGTFTLRTTTLGFVTPKKKFWVSGYKKPIKVNKNVIVMRGVHLEVKTKKNADRPAIVFRPY